MKGSVEFVGIALFALIAAACEGHADTTAAAQDQAALTPTVATTAPATPVSTHRCEGSPVECGNNASPPLPQAATGGQRYGAASDETVPLTALTDLFAQPSQFANKIVRTRGTIGRVCQHRGCWMELRSDVDGQVVKVPMAGHAFFVPSDVSGRTATVEGAVSVLEDAESPLRIDATSVQIADNQP